MTEEQLIEPTPPADSQGEKSRKERKKVRSVWIAFIGRIVAQFVGSAATIGLGVMLLYKYQPGPVAGVDLQAAARGNSAIVQVQAPQSHGDSSLAVLPLSSFSSNPAEAYVADSLTEILTADLAQFPWLHVVSRTSATNSAVQDQPLAAIAASLGVRYILEGSVAHLGGRVRITAQLIDATRDEHVWARRYERPAADILGVQEEVTADIVRELGAMLANEAEIALPTSGMARTR